MLDLWENLKNSPYPIALYGIGNGADKIIDILNEKGIGFCGVFSSDGFYKPNKVFRGKKVSTLEELEEEYGKLTVLMCFGSARKEVFSYVEKIKEKHLFFAPDVPVYGDILFDKNFYFKTENEHKWVYSILEDEKSKECFRDIVNFKLSGDIDYLKLCETSIDDAYTEILKLNNNETYIDLGAYRGDTVFEFLGKVKTYDKIYAVEPDIKTFKKLENAVMDLKNIELINGCISDTCKKGLFAMNGSRGSNSQKGATEIDFLTVDSIVGENKVTYIKADVEGAEIDFIKGAQYTILKNKPKMMISCYHRSDDLYKIPEAVLNIRKDYKVYMRHFPSIPAWDTVYFFI